jgi:hypothetical protein
MPRCTTARKATNETAGAQAQAGDPLYRSEKRRNLQSGSEHYEARGEQTDSQDNDVSLAKERNIHQWVGRQAPAVISDRSIARYCCPLCF